MMIAAAYAIASCVKPEQLGTECIIPSVFDRTIAGVVAEAVKKYVD